MSGDTFTDPVAVVIATSGGRTKVLIDRALRSVYAQKGVVPQCVYIVDDNPRKDGERESGEFNAIKKGAENLRKSVWLERREEVRERWPEMEFEDFFRTLVIPNRRTRGMSGTGAWNTAAMRAFQSESQPSDYQPLFLSILDDDDEWAEDHLFSCLSKIPPSPERQKEKCVAVIPGIRRIEEGGKTEDMIPGRKNFTAEGFFKGNPGFQGSGMFIDLDTFWSIGGFDESMRSCTDRDLAIRLLEYVGRRSKCYIKFTGRVTVKHYAAATGRVTVDRKAKTGGLNNFYCKHWAQFGESDCEQSLKRAKELFNYTPPPERAVEPFADEPPVAATADCPDTAKPFNLHIGAISDSSDNTKALLKSFLKIYERDGGKWLTHHTFHLLDNSDDEIGIKPVAEYFKNRKGLNVRVHDRKCPEKLSIAKARTALQRHILKAGRGMHGDDFVAWVVDDDSIFHTDLKGGGRTEPCYFGFIARHRSHADAMLCLVSGAPPLPFISTLRTQLLDFSYNLSNFSNCDPEAPARKSLLNPWQGDNPDDEEDFYYDLSKHKFGHLEKPVFWQPDYGKNPEMKVHEAFELFLKDTAGLAAGENVFRSLTYTREEIGGMGGESIHRGGNTVIYNPAMLDVPNYTPEEGYNRRSDFNWAVINTHIFKRRVCKVTLPVYHNRSSAAGAEGLKYDEEKFKADVKGMLFYRLLERMLKPGSAREDGELLDEFRRDEQYPLVAQIRANNYRARTLCIGIQVMLENRGNWWRHKDKKYRDGLNDLLERNLTFLRALRYDLGIRKQQKYIEEIPAQLEKWDEDFIARVREEVEALRPRNGGASGRGRR